MHVIGEKVLGPVAFQAGATVGSYTLVRPIGAGGAAVVYEAVHEVLGRRVAIKMLRAQPATAECQERATARFLREARVAAHVRHPNVIDVFDFGVFGSFPFLVMELVEGETLADRLRRERRLDVEAALATLLPIASAVAELHAAGIIHRDIKPSNVLLSNRRDIGPKLSDFGLSRRDDGSPPLTESGALLGTPVYMATELVLGAHGPTEATDVYSLGATLYECATGQAPFRGETIYDLIQNVARGLTEPPSAVEPSLPVAFDEVIARAMCPDPSERFASVDELGAALLPLASPALAARWAGDFGELPFAAPRSDAPPGPLETEGLAAPSDLGRAQVVHRGANLLLASIGPVYLAVWRRAVTRSLFELQRDGLSAHVERYPGGAAFLCVVEEGTRPPDAELRRASVAMVASHAARLRCLACVIEGSGFGAAVTRSVLGGMALALPNQRPPRQAFSTVKAAAPWLNTYLRLKPSELAKAIAELRVG
jgi:tRNA A-37 threonylcarbamoyl transferase component Bud32